MLSEDKQILLSGFLGQLPESVAARLAKAVEVDRLIGGTGLPHEDILQALRPQLRTSPQPARVPTPERFFCRPFEDLLVSADRATKQKGRIARTSIMPVWNWLASDLMRERHEALARAVREAVMKSRDEELTAATADLWSETAAVLRTALSDEKHKVAAARKLGGIAVAEDAAEMALLLGSAQDMAELQKRLPKPIANLSEDDVNFLRDMFDRLGKTKPDLASYVALATMGRLERPWEALRLTAVLSRKTDDTMISNTDVGIVGELLFSDLDNYVKKIQAARPSDFDSEIVLTNLAGFAELSSGMVKELGIRRDGKWGQRLAKDRGAVAQTLENLLERAPKEILAALPVAKIGGFSKGPKPLDLSRPPDPERVAKAMRYAHLMIHSRPFAVAAAFNAKLNEVTDETVTALRSYAEDVLREVKSAPGDARSNVRQYFEVTLDLCMLILGDEEADFLRRRARVHTSA